MRNQEGDITEIMCDVPLPEFDEIPFQTFEVLVNSRSAPHRFFFDDGEHFDELKMYMTPPAAIR